MKSKPATKVQQYIEEACDTIKDLLISKNKKYGNSALEPVRIFSSLDQSEQLCVRIDDKLSRIQKGAGLLASDEDVVNDLIGYLVLLKISQRMSKEENWDGTDIDHAWNTGVSTVSFNGTDTVASMFPERY